MNKKWLLLIILVLTIIAIYTIYVLNFSIKYNKLVISENKWNSIIDNKKEDTSLKIESITFNDYNLVIDEENQIIYYSIVDEKNKYNPSVDYELNQDKLKIAINKKLNDDLLEDNESLNIMIYNDTSYKIYKLIITKYPILNITYDSKETNKKRYDVNIYLFDNYVDSTRRVLKSNGKLRIIEEDEKYAFSLKKESPGRNKRENPVSIFGMEPRDEYLIKVEKPTNNQEKYVQFFINNKYKGIYSLGVDEERSMNNYERNRENNK